MTAPTLFSFADVADRLENLESGGTFIKPFVNTKVSESMAGGLNFLNNVSVPWDLTCDELIYCHQGRFRLVVDDVDYVLDPGDLMYVPKDNHVVYEADDKCVIFYAAYPVNWKELSGVTHVPGIDPEDMPNTE